MKVQDLLHCFEWEIPVEELAKALFGSQEKGACDVTSVYVSQLDSNGGFIIKRKHLLRLCNEVLNCSLSLADTNTIAFAVLTTELSDIEDGEMAGRVLFDWDDPEIDFPFTLENTGKWSLLLESKVDTIGIKKLERYLKTLANTGFT